jgi:hypothetical protein
MDASENRSERAGKFSKCGAVGGLRRSVGPIVREMKKYCTESVRRGILCVQ